MGRRPRCSGQGGRLLRVLACLAWLCLASATPARAQQSLTNHRPSADAQAVADGDEFPAEHLLGDWDGVRTDLVARGVELSFSYASETAAVLAGGAKQGVDYAHSLNGLADVDLHKLIGVEGLSVHAALVERAGRDASRDFLHDSLDQVQEIYGSGGDVAAHLVYLFAEQKLAGDHLDLEAGRMDVGQDFAASPLYCEFLNLSVCPNPRALTATHGFTVFPTATWGGRLKLSADIRRLPAYVQFGAFQVLPQGGDRSGFDFAATGTTGVFLPLEVGLTPRLGPSALVGHYKLGLADDTSKAPDLWEAQGGGPLALAGQVPRTHRGQALAYAAADQMLVRTGENGTDGVLLFGAYDQADLHTAMIDRTAVAGLLARGVVPGRPGDSIGLQATWIAVSNELTATERLEAMQDETLGSVQPDAASVQQGVQTSETIVEAVYNARLCNGFHISPDLQYVVHPGGLERASNGWVFAFRLAIDL